MPHQFDSLYQKHVELIYDSAGRTNGWCDLIERLVTDLGCRSGHITLDLLSTSGGIREIRQRSSKGICEEYNDAVMSHFYKYDFWTKALNNSTAGKFYCSEQLIPRHAMKGLEFYEDFVRKFDVEYLTAAIIGQAENSSIRVALQHTKSQGSCHEKAKYLQRLAPHLEKASDLHKRFSRLSTQTESLHSILDTLPTAIFVTDDCGKVKHLNHYADNLLSTSSLIKKRHDRLILKSQNNDWLQRVVKKASQDAQGLTTEPENYSLIERNKNGKSELEITVRPLSLTAHELGFQYRQALSLIIVEPIKPQEKNDLNSAKIFYKLTEKEAVVCLGLIKGKKLEEIASENHRALSTVRTHLKSIFRKTRTNSQQQLIALLMNFN